MTPRRIACLLLLAACRSTEPPPHPLAPRPVVETARWQVLDGDREIGHVVRREIRDPAGAVSYFHVENIAGQWLGYLDQHGRLYRFEPFVERERFLGVYSMEKGLGLLYDVDAPLRMVPVESAAPVREASAGR